MPSSSPVVPKLVAMREWVSRRVNRLRAPFLPEPYRTVFPFTMVGLKRLKSLRHLAGQIEVQQIPGDVVECGACNGGSGAILAQVVRGTQPPRRVWLLDSFEGLPPATEKDGTAAIAYTGACLASIESVQEVLRRCQVPAEQVTIVKGWFEETVPSLPVARIALLHIDADWYDSVKLVLEHLYDRVSPGGYVILDDYGYWEGCRRACHEFLDRRGIQVTLNHVDGIGVYFKKPDADQPVV